MNLKSLKNEMQDVLESNILRFWLKNMIDEENGGFYGRIDGQGTLHAETEKGAILNARIPTVVYGLREGKTGACGSVLDLFAEDFGFRPRMYGGVREAECRDLMQNFFSQLRE